MLLPLIRLAKLEGSIISSVGKDVVKCLCSYAFSGDIN